MAELAGTWLYRSFNPTFVMGNQTPEARISHPPFAGDSGVEDRLIFADARLTLGPAPAPTGLVGTIEWRGGGLNLNGTVLPGAGDEPVGLDIVGTGRPGTGTDGWEYRYHGYLTPRWPKPPDASERRPINGRPSWAAFSG